MQALRKKEEMEDKEGLGYVESPSRVQVLHETHWSSPRTPSHCHGHHHHHDLDHDHDHDHHHKKSVLAKVKDKAKRWRNILLKKKHSHEDDGNTTPTSTSTSTTTPTSAHAFDKENESIEQDPEYHGAPMYESEMAPAVYKEKAASSPTTPNSVLDHQAASNIKERSVLSPKTPSTVHHQDTQKEPKLHHLDPFKEMSVHPNLMAPTMSRTLVTETKAKEGDHDSNKTLTETVTEMLTPAYNMVSDATHKIAAKIHSPMARDELGAKMMWDKGVSMKEYLLQKLEPGEEEKALSEVITEAISPRKAGHGQGDEMSIVDKVRGAVSSLLAKEGPAGTPVNVHLAANPASQRTHGASRPLFKATHGTSIFETNDTQRSLIPTMKYSHGGSIPPPKFMQEASIPTSKDTQGSSIPSAGYTHGDLVTEARRTHVPTNPFYEDNHEALNKASDETVLPPSKGIHRALSSTSRDTLGDSIPSSVYIDGASVSTSGHAHLAPIAESKQIHGASLLAPEYSHVDSVPASKGNHEVSMHASEYPHESSIHSSQYAHDASVLDFIHAHGDSSPLPVSTNPSLIEASTSTSTISTSTDPLTKNVPRNPLPMNPHAEAEETSGRILQAYTN